MDTTEALAAAEKTISRIAAQILYGYPEDDVDDARQEVLIHVWRKIIPAWRDDGPATFSTFLFGAVKNALIDQKRKLDAQCRRSPSSNADDAAAPPAGADDLLNEIIDKPEDFLPRSKSKLLRALFATGSRTELAKRLGVSRDIADQRVCRLRKSIRDIAVARCA